MNPLFGDNPQGNMFGPFGGMMKFINQVNQFRQGFTGDPKQMVQQLRQNGQMSEQQFNYFSGIANSVLPFMRR